LSGVHSANSNCPTNSGFTQRHSAIFAAVRPCPQRRDIDLSAFGMEIVLNRRFAQGHSTRFEFVEKEPDQPFGDEPGLNAFLKDASLGGNVTQEEVEFLKRLRFKGKRPTPLYYYRELQNLRDPLHFRPAEG
jgi:hypothetical protein